MQIHCAPCTSSQIVALKEAAIIPSTADQCGLITKSDAERLTSYLNTSCLIEKDKESSTTEHGLATSSRICRKRQRNASPSTPPSSPSRLTDADEILTNAHSQGPSRTDECNPSLKKSKEPCSETNTIAPSASNYRKSTNSSASNICMEVIQSTTRQQINTPSENDEEVTNIIFEQFVTTQLHYSKHTLVTHVIDIGCIPIST